MIKKKMNYDVATVAKCLTDTATGEAGVVAFNTFRNEDIEKSNDYNIPFHAICTVKVSTSIEEVEAEDETCQEPPVPKPHIDGADNTSIRQGTDFDLTEGVTAYDADGNEIPFTVEPSEVDSCEVGEQTFTYSAEGITKERVITVTQIASPTINGIEEPIEVSVNEEFDPLDGVSAVDANGNEVPVTVHYFRTVLYADGTFIINEDSNDIAANEQEHGSAYYVYPPLDSEHDYVFASGADRYWNNETPLIKSIKFGSPIQPTSMRSWFLNCRELESFDATNLDTSECSNMRMLFKSGVKDSENNTKLISLDLSSWNTSKVTDMQQMFMRCTNLQTIYASNLFDVTNVALDNGMFANCTSLVGGAGTTFDSTKIDKTYARIDNPPDAPGYFTAKA